MLIDKCEADWQSNYPNGQIVYVSEGVVLEEVSLNPDSWYHMDKYFDVPLNLSDAKGFDFDAYIVDLDSIDPIGVWIAFVSGATWTPQYHAEFSGQLRSGVWSKVHIDKSEFEIAGTPNDVDPNWHSVSRIGVSLRTNSSPASATFGVGNIRTSANNVWIIPIALVAVGTLAIALKKKGKATR